MLDMINRSLDIFKMERGLYKCKFEDVDVIDVVGKVVTETKNICSMSNIEIGILINGRPLEEDDTFFIPGEQLLFFSMLENLIKNAIEASPDGAKINIYLKKNALFKIAIRNKGTVPEEIRTKFFDKFVTLNKDKGTGIGTYSAKLIAETMKGRISMESSEETGTTLTLTFPRSNN
jgi:signal transduction histidine kinase